ncbi:MAG: hypothetical protein HFI53_11385 [Lachnospiraceae bacterium]|nr:hypothetical protein [Lachnospiraceae bacterium]
MGIQEVQGNSKAQAYQKKKKAGQAEGFQESFLQNLKNRDQAKKAVADTQTGLRQNMADAQTGLRQNMADAQTGLRQNMADAQTGLKQNMADAQTETKQKAENVGVGRIGMTTGIRVNAAATQEALQAVEVRHMSYEESDLVKIAVTEGYTLKGKREDGADVRVYVEAKYDDGRQEAYQVEIDRVPENTEHMIEQFALETMKEG